LKDQGCRSLGSWEACRFPFSAMGEPRALVHGAPGGWGEGTLVVVAAAARWWRWLVAGTAGVATGPTARICESGRSHSGSKSEHRQQQRPETLDPAHGSPPFPFAAGTSLLSMLTRLPESLKQSAAKKLGNSNKRGSACFWCGCAAPAWTGQALRRTRPVSQRARTTNQGSRLTGRLSGLLCLDLTAEN
jgi:hypothetical protein